MANPPIVFTGSPDDFVSKVLLPGCRSYFENTLRKGLEEAAKKIIEDAQADLCAMVVKQIRAIKHDMDQKVEVQIVIENRNDRP